MRITLMGLLLCILAVSPGLANAMTCKVDDRSPNEYVEWNESFSFIRHYFLDINGNQFDGEILNDAGRLGGEDIDPIKDHCTQKTTDLKSGFGFSALCRLDKSLHGYDLMDEWLDYSSSQKSGRFGFTRYLGGGAGSFGFSFSECK